MIQLKLKKIKDVDKGFEERLRALFSVKDKVGVGVFAAEGQKEHADSTGNSGE